MPSVLAPLCLVALVAGAADDPSLVSVRRLSAPADVAIVSAAVRSGDAGGLAARDALAYRLLALGYSALETADIVTGHATSPTSTARTPAGWPATVSRRPCSIR